MFKHLRFSALILATLSACGDDADVGSDTYWRSHGYGYYIEIHDGKARTFHITDATCQEDLSLVAAAAALDIGEGGQDAKIVDETGEVPTGFQRIHRRHIVNWSRVEQVHRSAQGWSLTLAGHDEPLPIGRTRRTEVRRRFAE